MNVNSIRTEEDLKVWLRQENQMLDQMSAEVRELRTQSEARRLELAEQKITQLAEGGMPYDRAFELVVAELEEEEGRGRAQADRERAERIELELAEREREAWLKLEEEDRQRDN